MHQYSYQEVLTASQRANWKVEDLIGGEKKLDFAKPFMPESLARTQAMDFLNEHEKLVLNQIRGHGYLYLFGLTEEFILPFVMDHAREQLGAEDACRRAFIGFAAEEAKHIDLFKRFRQEFIAGFGAECEVIGPPEEIARMVLSHHPLAVALVILHIEWMTQRHYLDSIRDDRELDPMFKSLLRHHWMEEAQHAKLDTMMVGAMAANSSASELAKVFDEYFEIGALLDGGLKQQAAFDMESLSNETGRLFSEAEAQRFIAMQHQAQRWTFLGSGMSHPNFLATVQSLSGEARQKIKEASVTLS
jgi:hypothetical protein